MIKINNTVFVSLFVLFGLSAVHAEEIMIDDIVTELPIEGNISTNEEIDTYTFTAKKTGKYLFYSTYTSDRLDTYSSFSDENNILIAYNDDGNSYYNFAYSVNLEAGKVYHMKVNSYEGYYSGRYLLHVLFKDTATHPSLARYDFNGDGISDILWRKDDINHVWLMDENGSHTYMSIGGKSSDYNITGTGDFNGDGITDILWRKGHRNYLWYMNADGTHRYQKITSKSYTPQSIADFNNDGISDILWRKNDQNHIWYMHADGTHTYINIGGKSTDYTIAGTGDFNGDGNIDILWRKGYRNYIWYMHADGTHTYKKIDSKRAEFAGIGDFNGDGIADILWDNGSIWYMNKDASHYYEVTGESSANIKIADFNGDGISDILYDFPNESKLIRYSSINEFFRDIGSKNGYRAY